MTEHPEWDCPHCEECDGCGGGDGSNPRNPVLDRTTYPGLVMLRCGDCRGQGIVCNCRCHVEAAQVAR